MATITLDPPHTRARGVDLPYSDGEPLESEWHVLAMGLLIQILRYHYRERRDIYMAGNMFVYFDEHQAKNRHFRGPDFFVVKGVKSTHYRNSWVIWEEDNRAPDYVIELASPSTKAFDLAGKKAIYEHQLQTPEYVVYDPATHELRGWRLDDQGRYQECSLDKRGWLWSEQLGLWLGADDYAFTAGRPIKTLRFYDTEGRLLLTEAEARAALLAQAEGRADAEAARADAEAVRADNEAARAATEAARAQAAEAEVARLRALLEQKPPAGSSDS